LKILDEADGQSIVLVETLLAAGSRICGDRDRNHLDDEDDLRFSTEVDWESHQMTDP